MIVVLWIALPWIQRHASAADATAASFTNVTTLMSGKELHRPSGVAVDPSNGDVYVADTKNHQIKRVSPAGVSTILAGSGVPGLTDGNGRKARFHEPAGLAFDPVQNVLYVADRHNHTIRRVTLAGDVMLAAGTGKRGFRNGGALTAEFDEPSAIALGGDGELYVADTRNNVIRRVGSDGSVSTFAGTGRAGLAEGPAAAARFAAPEGIAIRRDGTLFVADTGNDRIRSVHDGIVATVAGNVRGASDGTALAATFRDPRGIAVGDDGTIYVADTGNGLIRQVHADLSVVSTLAGSPERRNLPQLVDGPVARATFNEPSALAFAGALVVADSRNDAVRMIHATLRLTAVSPGSGPRGSGNEVTVEGQGFVPGRIEVRFGDTEARSFRYVRSTELLVVVPPGSGLVDVVARIGNVAATLPDAYRFLSPPEITSLTPVRGPVAGGQPVVIDGREFIDGATDVLFGAVPAPFVAVESSDRISATTPPASEPGVTDVVVRTAAGDAARPGAYTYLAAPSIAAYSPVSGPVGTHVEIIGAHFGEAPAENDVRFGGVPAVVLAALPGKLVAVVPPAAQSSPISVVTEGGSAVASTSFVVVDFVGLRVVPAAAAIEVGETLQLRAIARRSDGSEADVSATAEWSTSALDIVTVTAGSVRGASAGAATVTAKLGALAASAVVTVRASEPLPPDPSTVAPILDRTRVATLHESVRFLFAGDAPIQRGVAVEAIEPRRVAVVRGSVRGATGSALPGVKVTVADAPQYGSTLTRADGVFDLAVNGGGTVRLRFERTGYMTVDRQVRLQWEQQRTMEPVFLLQYDTDSTAIVGGAPIAQVARGSVASDADGTRRATLVFPPHTTAEMVFRDGTTQVLDRFTVRATEYTVGPNGLYAMPAPLPPATAYTYCVELSADEATAAGASTVRFSTPAIFYIENFRQFPAGEIMPSGYYDRDAGIWKPLKNGRVVKIVSVTGGAANVDVDGNGTADPGALGMTQTEREQLAQLYQAGQTLWRVPIPHFTPVDHNLPLAMRPPRLFNPPVDAKLPEVPFPSQAPRLNDGCGVTGYSTVECENGTLGEQIPIVGTPFTLDYNSGRAARTQYDLTVSLTDAAPHAELLSVGLTIEIAGRRFDWTYAPAPNLKHEFTWDGKDVYGREVQGSAGAEITVEFFYPQYYVGSVPEEEAFGRTSWRLISFGRVPTTAPFPVRRNRAVTLGRFDVAPTGFGGWTFSAMTLFDFKGQLLYLPGGVNRGVDPQQDPPRALSDGAGTGDFGNDGDGGPSTAAKLAFPSSVAVGPDGSMYIATGSRIRKVDAEGMITTIAGTGSFGFTGDGGPATAARIDAWSIDLGADGQTVFFTNGGTRVRRIDRDGIVTTVAGNGTAGYSGDGGPATAAALRAEGVTAAPDGSVYVAAGAHVRQIGIDGIIRTIAGGNITSPTPGDNGPAIQARLEKAVAVAFGPDGSLYIADVFTDVIRRVTPDGTIHTIAGTFDSSAPDAEDGTLAAEGRIYDPAGLAVGSDGTVLFAESSRGKIRAVRRDGRITTIAGNGERGRATRIQGAPARGTNIVETYDVKTGPDGSIYVVDAGANTIRRAETTLPSSYASRTGAVVLASGSPDLAYRFASGRHVETVDRLTGTVLQTLRYDEDHRLVEVANVDGLATRIERDGNGVPRAIVAPGGQRTTLEVGADGLLASIRNPAGEEYAFTYGDEGLLSTLVNPRGGVHEFVYDDNGRLRKDTDPAGGFIELSIAGSGSQYTVSRSSAEGMTFKYGVGITPDGDVSREVTNAAGLKSASSRRADGSAQTVAADGTIQSMMRFADPGFGIQSGRVAESTLMLPSGRTLSVEQQREVTFADPANPLSLLMRKDTTIIDGRPWTTSYAAANRTITTRTPLGRETISTLDGKGRVVRVAAPAIAPTELTYDGRGRLSSIMTGARTLTLDYDGRDQLISMTDALGRQTTFGYDSAGRVTTQTLPGSRSIGMTYDAAGNVATLNAYGSTHRFTYNGVNLPTSYSSPGSTTSVAYDKDRRVTTITRPGTAPLTMQYDAAGRPAALVTPEGNYSWQFSPLTGQPVTSTTPSGDRLEYTFDGALMEQTRWSGTIRGLISHEYDNSLRVVYENGVVYSYDDDGVLTAAGALTLSRDPVTATLTGTVMGRVRDYYTYDQYGEVESYRVDVDAESILAIGYQRDAGGRLDRITESAQAGSEAVRQYEYDAAGRLAAVRLAGVTVAEHDYDVRGNRLAHRSVDGGTATATYDSDDRMLTYGSASFTYSAAGDLQEKREPGAVTRYTYDSLGNLRTVEQPGRVVEYIMDAQHRRVGKRVDGVLVSGWLYADTLRIVVELDGSGVTRSTFAYGSRVNIPDYMTSGGVQYRIIADHLGSPRLVIDTTTGAVVQRMDFDEYGRVLVDTNPGFQPFGFAGGLYDRDTGLVRFGARDYDPSMGRWTSKDPSLFTGGTNLYAYTFNDPVNFIDRDGRVPVPLVTGLIGGAAGGVGSIAMQLWSNRHAGWGSLNCINWGDVGIATGTGFMAGLAAPYTAVTWLGAIGTSALANEVQYVATEIAHGNTPAVTGALWSVGTGAVAGGIGGKFTPVSAGYNEASVITSAAQRKIFKNMNNDATNASQVAFENLLRNAGGNVTAGAPAPGSGPGGCGCQ